MLQNSKVSRGTELESFLGFCSLLNF